MLKTELKIPFVFYNALIKQHRFRRQNKGEVIHPLICSSHSFLPFEIKTTLGSNISSLLLFNTANVQVANLSSNITNIESYSDASSTWFIYKGNLLTGTLPLGCYYLVANGVSTPYSEIFKVIQDAKFNEVIEIRWKSSCDIGPVIYSTGYENKIYLDTYVEAQQPEFAEDGEENGFGEFVPTLQRLVQKQKIETFAPDYLQDALAFMQMHDSVVVSDYTDSNVPMKRIKVTSDYGEDYLGTSRIEFEFDEDYIKTGCCVPGETIETCNIQITNITRETTTDRVTTISFSSVLNGGVLDHYQWRSGDFAGNAWQNIGTNKSFTHTFTAGTLVTVQIQGVCDNSLGGAISVISFTDNCQAVNIPNQLLPNALANGQYAATINVTGSLPITIEYDVPAWMFIPTISGNTITFLGVPTNADVGTHIPVSITVTNCVNHTDTFTWFIDVIDPVPKIIDTDVRASGFTGFKHVIGKVTLDRVANGDVVVNLLWTDASDNIQKSIGVTVEDGQTVGTTDVSLPGASPIPFPPFCVLSVTSGTVDLNGFGC